MHSIHSDSTDLRRSNFPTPAYAFFRPSSSVLPACVFVFVVAIQFAILRLVSLRVEAKPVRLIFLSTSSPNAPLLRSSASTPSSSVFFSVSWGAVPVAVAAEVFPLSIRVKGLSPFGAANWLWNFGVPYATPYLLDPSTTGAKGIKRAGQALALRTSIMNLARNATNRPGLARI
ncbi:hypothetical protein BJ912DRAFT_1146071 [Pholiota molesta]|nr:hypothetical protein BJ912DRAFT_1146071 [Pholiota molesta]